MKALLVSYRRLERNGKSFLSHEYSSISIFNNKLVLSHLFGFSRSISFVIDLFSGFNYSWDFRTQWKPGHLYYSSRCLNRRHYLSQQIVCLKRIWCQFLLAIWKMSNRCCFVKFVWNLISGIKSTSDLSDSSNSLLSILPESHSGEA
jgi:hypothetical protein